MKQLMRKSKGKIWGITVRCAWPWCSFPSLWPLSQLRTTTAPPFFTTAAPINPPGIAGLQARVGQGVSLQQVWARHPVPVLEGGAGPVSLPHLPHHLFKREIISMKVKMYTWIEDKEQWELLRCLLTMIYLLPSQFEKEKIISLRGRNSLLVEKRDR